MAGDNHEFLASPLQKSNEKSTVSLPKKLIVGGSYQDMPAKDANQ